MSRQMLRLFSLLLALCGVAPVRAADLSSPVPDGEQDRARALQCMTLAIAYEAGLEPVEGRQAVGEVILNRMRNPAYP